MTKSLYLYPFRKKNNPSKNVLNRILIRLKLQRRNIHNMTTIRRFSLLQVRKKPIDTPVVESTISTFFVTLTTQWTWRISTKWSFWSWLRVLIEEWSGLVVWVKNNTFARTVSSLFICGTPPTHGITPSFPKKTQIKCGIETLSGEPTLSTVTSERPDTCSFIHYEIGMSLFHKVNPSKIIDCMSKVKRLIDKFINQSSVE